MAAYEREWESTSPAQARELLRRATVSWWIAGGWALDLFLGRETRSHADLDVGCFREDFEDMRRALRGWELHAAKRGILRKLGEEGRPEAGVNSIWCRPLGTQRWWLELLLDEREGEEWVYRRNRSIRFPLSLLVAHDAEGVPFLRPEVQLLYKAKEQGEKDEADFRAVIPSLGTKARAWLREALERAHPAHEWLRVLDRAV